MRSVDPNSEFKKGDRVRLHPRSEPVFSTPCSMEKSPIEAVEEDFEGKLHIAVVIEDDPGKDFGEMHQSHALS